ncbi:hypothetical protein BDZ97DRAFT_1901213 [Flammula alnicola]|nr:hypothetical protein BDZ97DRAFT_1901213 [Flammula alnicola]
MPPQPGLFAVPLGTTPTHTLTGIATAPSSGAIGTIAPVGPGMGAGLGLIGGKEKKRKESSKLGKEMSDRRDDGRHFTESISALHNAAHVLSTRPELSAYYRLRLYPITLERSALLAQLEVEERYAIECAQVAYDEERGRVEDEWRRGRERVRERLLEGIEERRRRAREEKEGEGTVGDAALDSHSRPPITRKLRNKLGTSPPPTPHTGGPGSIGSHHPLSTSTFSVHNAGNPNGTLLSANLPITTGPFLNPHSLSVEDLPSPFPLPLTSTQLPHASGGGAGGASGGLGAGAGGAGGQNGGRRRVKGGGAHQGQAVGGLGKSLVALNTIKDQDLENDLGEIRRGNKRRRATAAASMAKTGAVM